MNEERSQLLLSAQNGLVIESVTLRHSNITTDDCFTSFTAGQYEELGVQSKKDLLQVKLFNQSEDDSEYGLVCLEYFMGTRLILDHLKDEEEAVVLFEVEALFSANYSINDSKRPSEKAIRVFAEENGLYHVWPYWREFIQSTCSRVGIPPVPVEMRPGVVSAENLDRQESVELPRKG